MEYRAEKSSSSGWRPAMRAEWHDISHGEVERRTAVTAVFLSAIMFVTDFRSEGFLGSLDRAGSALIIIGAVGLFVARIRRTQDRHRLAR